MEDDISGLPCLAVTREGRTYM